MVSIKTAADVYFARVVVPSSLSAASVDGGMRGTSGGKALNGVELISGRSFKNLRGDE